MDAATTEQLRRTVQLSDQLIVTQRKIEELQNRLLDEQQNLADLQSQLSAASTDAMTSLSAAVALDSLASVSTA